MHIMHSYLLHLSVCPLRKLWSTLTSYNYAIFQNKKFSAYLKRAYDKNALQEAKPIAKNSEYVNIDVFFHGIFIVNVIKIYAKLMCK